MEFSLSGDQVDADQRDAATPLAERSFGTPSVAEEHGQVADVQRGRKSLQIDHRGPGKAGAAVDPFEPLSGCIVAKTASLEIERRIVGRTHQDGEVVRPSATCSISNQFRIDADAGQGPDQFAGSKDGGEEVASGLEILELEGHIGRSCRRQRARCHTRTKKALHLVSSHEKGTLSTAD